jgi:hypothetical protein
MEAGHRTSGYILDDYRYDDGSDARARDLACGEAKCMFNGRHKRHADAPCEETDEKHHPREAVGVHRYWPHTKEADACCCLFHLLPTHLRALPLQPVTATSMHGTPLPDESDVGLNSL